MTCGGVCARNFEVNGFGSSRPGRVLRYDSVREEGMLTIVSKGEVEAVAQKERPVSGR
jgi:hypothetical protein